MMSGNHRVPQIFNLARIIHCEILEAASDAGSYVKSIPKETLVLELTDERNALERCMTHFSHLEKETERIGDRQYRLTLRYEKDNEQELIIRVLSFGHLLKVISPYHFRAKLKYRIEKQMKLRPQK